MKSTAKHTYVLLDCVSLLHPSNNMTNMETVHPLKVSSEGLLERGVEPATRGLNGEQLINLTKVAPSRGCILF